MHLVLYIPFDIVVLLCKGRLPYTYWKGVSLGIHPHFNNIHIHVPGIRLTYGISYYAGYLKIFCFYSIVYSVITLERCFFELLIIPPPQRIVLYYVHMEYYVRNVYSESFVIVATSPRKARAFKILQFVLFFVNCEF